MHKNKAAPYAWAVYDLANTIFSMNIVSLYFALWVTVDKGGKDIHYSLVFSGSVLASLFLAPVLGRLADVHHKKLLALILSTLLCVVAIGCAGIFNRLDLGLLLFFFANIGFQLGNAFYDSLLPSVAQPKEYGRISGLGVSLGYAGSILGILMISPLVETGGEIMRHRAFLPTAGLFLLFALPCFIFVREKKTDFSGSAPAGVSALEGMTISAIFKEIKKHPGVFPFFMTMFFAQNAAHTIIVFMAVYSVQAAGFSQNEVSYFFIIATCVAVIAAYAIGRLVDRLGALTMFRAAIVIGIIGLAFIAASAGTALFWIGGFFIGSMLGGLWTSSRPLLLSFIPEAQSATFFGINLAVGRFSAILGPLAWGLIVWLCEPLGALRYRLAVCALLGFMMIAFFISRRISR